MTKRVQKFSGAIYRGVVTFIDERTRWGKLVYATTQDGDTVVDALSAALMVKAKRAARGIRTDGVRKNKTLIELEFHTTSWRGAGPNSWLPQPGETVEVRLNSDYQLVAVWYAS